MDTNEFDKLLQQTKEAFVNLCVQTFRDMTHSLAVSVAAVRALAANDISKLPDTAEFGTPSGPVPKEVIDRFSKMAGHSRGSHQLFTMSAMHAAREVVPLEYGVTIILNHITNGCTCLASSLDDSHKLGRLLRSESETIFEAFPCDIEKIVN